MKKDIFFLIYQLNHLIREKLSISNFYFKNNNKNHTKSQLRINDEIGQGVDSEISNQLISLMLYFTLKDESRKI